MPDDHDELHARIIEALDRRRRRTPGERPKPVAALALARAYDVRPGGSDDSRKRGVRVLVRELRRQGVPIVADYRGYWMAEHADDHARYQAFRRRLGLANLAAASADARSDSMADATGQLALFGSCLVKSMSRACPVSSALSSESALTTP